jgi:hypothetical protein
VGNIGSDKRAKYGVVGRHVNLTARIESCTVGSQILISEATHREVGALMTIAEPMQVTAKGIEAPITLYDVRGVGGAYNLASPLTEEPLWPLPTAVPLWYTVVEDKRPGVSVLAGRLVKVARKGAEIHSQHTVAPQRYQNSTHRWPWVHCAWESLRQSVAVCATTAHRFSGPLYRYCAGSRAVLATPDRTVPSRPHLNAIRPPR